MGTETLEKEVKRLTAEGELFEKISGDTFRCFSCGHRCPVKKGRAGICGVRFNDGRALRVPFGYTTGVNCDPIEKKPFYHVLPGSYALSFGMLGCSFHCSFCQNWHISQSLRDRAPARLEVPVQNCSAGDIVNLARKCGAPVIASTYNEPLITSEWAAAIFREAKPAGIRCAYVSNGYATRKVLQYLKPWMDFFNVDLKFFDDRKYRRISGGVLKTVMETIEALKEMGFWVEVITLVIPGVNDSDTELSSIAKFLSGVSKDIPWHVTAFHKDYKMTEPPNTSVKGLVRAAEIGRAQGLRHVYAGNLPGAARSLENTYCPSCNTLLVERLGFEVIRNAIKTTGTKGRCPTCSREIAGVWA